VIRDHVAWNQAVAAMKKYQATIEI